MTVFSATLAETLKPNPCLDAKVHPTFDGPQNTAAFGAMWRFARVALCGFMQMQHLETHQNPTRRLVPSCPVPWRVPKSRGAHGWRDAGGSLSPECSVVANVPNLGVVSIVIRALSSFRFQ